MVIRVFLQVILFMLNCFYTCTLIMLFNTMHLLLKLFFSVCRPVFLLEWMPQACLILIMSRFFWRKVRFLADLSSDALQAFSQTLKTGCPEGMFSHNIIIYKRLSEFFLKKLAFIGWLDTLLAKTLQRHHCKCLK